MTKKRYDLAIDCSRYATHAYTGVELYSREIVDGIIQFTLEHPEFRLLLFTKVPTFRNLPANITEQVIDQKRLWTLIGLSWAILKDSRKISKLFIPSHTLPLITPGRTYTTIHDVAFCAYPNAYSLIDRTYLYLTTWFSVLVCKRLIVPSETTKNDLVRYFRANPERISVVSHGYTVKKEDTQSGSLILSKYGLVPGKYSLFIGRIETKKNLMRMLDAFAMVSPMYPGYKLVCIGKDGHGAEEIHAHHQKLNTYIRESIIFTGYMKDEECSVLLKNAHTFMFTTLYEGFGFPILEGFEVHVPVITSNTTASAEVAGDGALTVDPLNTQEIANAIKQLIDNESLRQELIKKGNERLKLYSWSKAVAETIRVLGIRDI